MGNPGGYTSPFTNSNSWANVNVRNPYDSHLRQMREQKAKESQYGYNQYLSGDAPYLNVGGVPIQNVKQNKIIILL